MVICLFLIQLLSDTQIHSDFTFRLTLVPEEMVMTLLRFLKLS